MPINPNLAEFTALEAGVLSAVCRRNPELTDFTALLSTAQLKERENTGHGFYTRFTVDTSMPALAHQARLVDGPNAEVSLGQDVLLMGFILWLDGGYPACLEGYQYANLTTGIDVDLRRIDLGELALGRLAWFEAEPDSPRTSVWDEPTGRS